MPRRLAILGSTGSIGTATLDVVRHLGPDRFSISALTTHRRVDLLLEQAERFRPKVVAVTGETVPDEHRRKFDKLGIELLEGVGACAQIAARTDVDHVVSAVVGAVGLPAAIAAIESGKPLALANKESLVVAGSILIPLARSRGVPILPIDSEHSAILQCLRSGAPRELSKVILTASGGPFRTAPIDAMRIATAAEALKHPTWRMGQKITVDSATMFNKAFELIEAAWLFDLPADRLDVVIHPQSLIHSMVEFVDGSVVAQLSPPDMRTPIQYALTYPDRIAGAGKRMDWSKIQQLDFEPPDLDRFPSLKFGFEAIRRKGTYGAALNAANEVAVAAFLSGRIRLGVIFELVHRIVERHCFVAEPTLPQLLAADRDARQAAEQWLADRADKAV